MNYLNFSLPDMSYFCLTFEENFSGYRVRFHLFFSFNTKYFIRQLFLILWLIIPTSVISKSGSDDFFVSSGFIFYFLFNLIFVSCSLVHTVIVSS